MEDIKKKQLVLQKEVDGRMMEIAHPSEYMNQICSQAESDMESLKNVGSLKKEEMWEELTSLQLAFPVKLSKMIRRYATANNRLEILERQLTEIRFDLKNQLQRKFNRQLSSADDINGALLSEQLYDVALMNRNNQLNYVSMLEKYMEQYRYIHTTVSNVLETIRLRRDMGY